MAASCNLLQLPFLKNHRFPSVSPSLPCSLSNPSRRFLPLPSSTIRPSASLDGSFRLTSEAFGSVDPVEASFNPALRHANVLFYRSGYNVQIVVDEDEPDEVLLRRFRREVSKAGVIQECKRRRYFENKHDEKKRKAREAGRRNRRRRFGPRFMSSTSPADGDAAPRKGKEDADDNWDMPEGDLPY